MSNRIRQRALDGLRLERQQTRAHVDEVLTYFGTLSFEDALKAAEINPYDRRLLEALRQAWRDADTRRKRQAGEEAKGLFTPPPALKGTSGGRGCRTVDTHSIWG